MEQDKIIMELIGDNGIKVKYELIDIIEYNEKTYAVFYPTEEGDTEVVVLRVEEAENREQSIYVFEENDEITKRVYEIFKVRHKYDYDFKED